jgi:hypothetical protein
MTAKGKIFFLSLGLFIGLLFGLIFKTQSWAQQPEIKSYAGESQFSGDKFSDEASAKSYGKYLATKELVNKALRNLSLDKNPLWTNFQSQFEKHFKVIEGPFRASFPPSMGSEYPKAVKEKKMQEEALYFFASKIYLAVDSLEVQSQTLNPLKTVVKGNIKEALLKSAYEEIVGSFKFKKINKIIIDVTSQKTDQHWAALNLSSKDDFIKTLKETWKDYLKNKMPSSIEIVVLENNENLSNKIEDGALYLNFNFNIDKLQGTKILKKQNFKLDLVTVFQDPITKKTLLVKDFHWPLKEFQYSNSLDLSNQVVTQLFKMPMEIFPLLMTYIYKVPINENNKLISFSGPQLQTMDQWLDLQSQLTDKDNEENLNLELVEWDGVIFKANVKSQLTQGEFFNRIKGWDGLSLKSGAVLKFKSDNGDQVEVGAGTPGGGGL